MSNFIKTLFLLFIPFLSFSQEKLIDIHSFQSVRSNLQLKKTNEDKNEIPFLEDFNYYSGNKSSSFVGKNVFINNTYQVNPISIGVATLDAYNYKGELNKQQANFYSDSLIFNYFDFSNYLPQDSIHLSFLYQAKGKSDDNLSQNDSLLLYFFAPVENKWNKVWFANGNNQQTFKNIIIPIKEDKYLQNGFKFMFANHISINPNNEPEKINNIHLWNVDYIYIDKDRKMADTIFNDVAIVEPSTSVLNYYEAVPWTHFDAIDDSFTEIKDKLQIKYQNNGKEPKNIGRGYIIKDLKTGQAKYTSIPNFDNLNAHENIDYSANLSFPFNYVSTQDSGLFEIKSFIITDGSDLSKKNDTTVYLQKFYNYYAHDDGTSEGGYGIDGEGSLEGKFAYLFNPLIADSLRAVQIYFNHTFNDANKQPFYLTIWENNGGQPGNIIYQNEDFTPEFESELNKFHTYILAEPIFIKTSFFVGWVQPGDKFLNVGFDKNRPVQNKMYYNLINTWIESKFASEGTVMIRPVFGKKQELNTSVAEINKNEKINIYPNPAKDKISVDYKKSADFVICNVLGTVVKSGKLSSQEINISNLPDGVYFVKIFGKNITNGLIGKFIKSGF